MDTVLGKVSTILYEPILEETNVLYESLAIRSAAEVFIGQRSMYTFCQS